MNQAVNQDGISADVAAFVDAILAVLCDRTGCDFSGYRLPTVYRRIRNRMISLGVGDFADYLTLLKTTEGETAQLLTRVTIKVSRFYRNAGTFDVLRRRVIPDLAAARSGAPLRVWSAGCGYGEEPYSLAMLLDEAGVAGIVEASDIDPAALDYARVGVYAVEAAAGLPAELIDRYLERVHIGDRECYRVRDSLRQRVRFARHDLLSPACPPGDGSFDLLCCRNVLIYLQRDTQDQLQQRLRRTVAAGGFLCLGEAEWPSKSVAASLAPLGRKTYLFRALETRS